MQMPMQAGGTDVPYIQNTPTPTHTHTHTVLLHQTHCRYWEIGTVIVIMHEDFLQWYSSPPPHLTPSHRHTHANMSTKTVPANDCEKDMYNCYPREISGSLTCWTACTVRSMASCILSETSDKLKWLVFTDCAISLIRVTTGIWRLSIITGRKKRQRVRPLWMAFKKLLKFWKKQRVDKEIGNIYEMVQETLLNSCFRYF